MKNLFKALGIREWIYVVCTIGFIVLQVWLDLKSPEFLQLLLKEVQQDGTNGAVISMAVVWKYGGLMLACVFSSMIAAMICAFFSGWIAATVSSNLRARLFAKVSAFSSVEINRFSTPSLITRSTNDITQVQMLIAMGLQVIVKAPIMAIWAIIKIVNLDVGWIIATIIAVVVLVVVLLTLLGIVFPKFTKIQKLTDNVNGITRENLTGIRVVRAYNAENYQQKKFSKANANLTKVQLFSSRTLGFLSPFMTMVMSGLTLAIYWIAKGIMDKNPSNVVEIGANIATVTLYATQVVMAFIMLSFIFLILPRTIVSLRRINEVLKTDSSILDGSTPAAAHQQQGTVTFKNVSFAYPNASDAILHNINFTVDKGETVAFIGATGAGKTSLINLIPRLFDATEGEVLVNGVNVKEYALADLRDKVAIVTQKAILFSGTIESNVSYGKRSGHTHSIENVKKSVEIAQAKNFVEKMEENYNSPVAQGGTNYSGGQRQRLSIARAIARNAEIFIFDDSFSALDYKTDKELRNALKQELKDATKLIVAQRIGTIKDADKILVLDEGKIVGMGKHKELLETCPIYREIALSQLSEEELHHE